ncbi:hypothetical protein [Parasitella parasitica]|uniref:SET domain-containing protein n=1 Tax=Parasitella parasitica TaxID=35722 RepID=A0A0B7MVC3_9FUNG|nr:hypothetical protein [Parasitella parasitica]
MDFSILSRHDDILASYFLDNLYLWFKTVRMNSDSICATGEQQMAIDAIRQMANLTGSQTVVVNNGVKQFLQFPYFKEYVSKLSVKEAKYFDNHLRRYLYMFSHQAGFEVSSTTRYTGTMEACILATKDWKVGEVVTCCAGAITELTKEDDAKLKREGRDFSVMVSTRRKCTCLFLGPARFMNFMLAGPNSITFKVQRDIKCGEEMTVYYADHYFAKLDHRLTLLYAFHRLQEGSFYVEKSDSEATEKDDAISPKTPPEDENIHMRRRSGRAKKDVDYIYRDILNPPRIKKVAISKPKKVESAGCSNIPLYEITNGKALEQTVLAMTIEDVKVKPRPSKKPKQVEMDLKFICNEPQPNHWVTIPAHHDCGLYTQVPWQYEKLFQAQQEMLECSEEFIGQLIHLPLPPLKSQFSNRYHPGGTEGIITFDKEMAQLYQWIDDQSDISDSEGSIVTDLNVATCCETAKDFRTFPIVRLSNCIVATKVNTFVSLSLAKYKNLGVAT